MRQFEIIFLWYISIFNIEINWNHHFYSNFHSKIVELEEELRVVGNNLKSLEVSEEKVSICIYVCVLCFIEGPRDIWYLLMKFLFQEYILNNLFIISLKKTNNFLHLFTYQPTYQPTTTIHPM